MITAFQRNAFQNNAFQIGGLGGIAEGRRNLRNEIKPKQLEKIFAAKTSWQQDINKAYGKIQKVIDDIEAMTPLERMEYDLSQYVEQRDAELRKNTKEGRRRALQLERRINELYTEIYRLKLSAELHVH